jgi:hypothetical protein
VALRHALAGRQKGPLARRDQERSLAARKGIAAQTGALDSGRNVAHDAGGRPVPPRENPLRERRVGHGRVDDDPIEPVWVLHSWSPGACPRDLGLSGERQGDVKKARAGALLECAGHHSRDARATCSVA